MTGSDALAERLRTAGHSVSAVTLAGLEEGPLRVASDRPPVDALRAAGTYAGHHVGRLPSVRVG